MAEETIFSNPHRRVYLVTGETNDWYIGRNLVMVNFEIFLSRYLQEIGYDHVMFYGGNTFRGKYVLDEISSRHVFQKENEKNLKGSVSETSGTPDTLQRTETTETRETTERTETEKTAENPEGSKRSESSKRRRPGDRRRREREAEQHAKEESKRTEESTETVGTGAIEAAATAEEKTAEKTIEEKNVEEKEEQWKLLTYGKEHISQAVFCGQFKEFMADTKHSNAMVFSDLDAFLHSEYYTNYMEMLAGWIEKPSRSRNIVIFIASGYSIKQLQSVFHSRPEFARMFADVEPLSGGEGEQGGLHFDSSRVLSLYLPGEDECIRLLEHLRIVGVRDRTIAGMRNIKESLEDIQARFLRLDFDIREEREIARTLRFHCYEAAGKEKRSHSALVEMEHRISEYMRNYPSKENGKIPFDTKAASQLYGKEYREQKSALEELNRPGWEEVYQVLADVIADNEQQKKHALQTISVPEREENVTWICQRMMRTVSSDSKVKIPHFLLMGPPGTGKTTIANKIGQVLNEAGILSSGHTVNIKGAELISGHVGGTAHLVADAVERAKNGVLFLDEAYGLVSQTEGHGRDFAQAAVDTLVAYCGEEQQEEFPFCLILAGYPDELEPIFRMNSGLRRRLTYTLRLNPYSAEHLAKIYQDFIAKKGYTLEPEIQEGMVGFFENLRTSVPSREFGNAGTAVQEIGEELTIRNCSARDAKNGETEGYQERCIRKEDFGDHIKYFALKHGNEEERIQEMKEQIFTILKSRVGNEDLKEKILELLVQVEYNIRYPEQREQIEPGYYFFVGPPGTGKSTAADTLALCLKAMDLVNDSTVIEISAKDLIAGYVGQTRGMTDQQLKRSYKRVLLIDEAYALQASGGQHDYEGQAMTEIVAFLDKEENRKNCCIIFAGYQEDMRRLTGGQTGNSGLISRIGENVIDFVPYTGAECAKILQVLAGADSKVAYQVSDEIMQYYETLFGILREEPRFANGRTVRDVLKIMKKRIKSRVIRERYAPNDARITQFIMQDVLSEEEVRELLSKIDN